MKKIIAIRKAVEVKTIVFFYLKKGRRAWQIKECFH